MNLAIFDIDGTLTNTNQVDESTFKKALLQCYQIENPSSDWAAYKYSTDSGILTEIFESQLKRSLEREEVQRYKEIFYSLLKDSHQKLPQAFTEIAGAAKMLKHLPEKAGWKIAIATGSWRQTAEFKLTASKVMDDCSKLPFASADDAYERFDIIKKVWRDSEIFYRASQFKRVVYVGDGIWDHMAATHLGIGFVGLAYTEASYQRLKARNVLKILKDYQDLKAFVDILESH